MHEYSFDIKLFAVARITAPDKKTAIRAMKDAISCLNSNDVETGDPNVVVTEASLATDGEERFEPFEIEGEPED